MYYDARQSWHCERESGAVAQVGELRKVPQRCVLAPDAAGASHNDEEGPLLRCVKAALAYYAKGFLFSRLPLYLPTHCTRCCAVHVCV